MQGGSSMIEIDKNLIFYMGIRSRSLGLSEVQGRHADQQQHRRPVGDPGHPQSPGHPARQVQAAAEYTKQASKFPNATWTMFLNSPSMTISSIGTLNIPGTNIFRRKL